MPLMYKMYEIPMHDKIGYGYLNVRKYDIYPSIFTQIHLVLCMHASVSYLH